jgi:LmbE family N-acetylglucosaminyl deacetylase
MHRWRHAGHAVLVVNVMSADPPRGPSSSFAEALHRRWGAGAGQAYAKRRSEDAMALAALGAGAISLGYIDCIYRSDAAGPFYDSEQAIFGSPHPADAALTDRLAASIAALAHRCPQALFYAPLGIGHHVDHQLVRSAAERAVAGRLWFYEDYPYAAEAGALEPFLRAGPGGAQSQARLRPVLVVLNRTDVRAKVRAISCYESQIGVLFGSRYAMARAVWRDLASSGRQEGWRERYWGPGA